MQENIAKLEATIRKQGKKISKLKQVQQDIPLEDNEYKRLIRRLLESEKELRFENEELKDEIKKLAEEISELLKLLTESIEVQNDNR